MTASEFNIVSFEEQKATLLHQGVYLAYRHSSEHTVLLFQLEGFYVELYYHKKNEASLQIQTFTMVDALEPYLLQIEIPPLWMLAATDVNSWD